MAGRRKGWESLSPAVRQRYVSRLGGPFKRGSKAREDFARKRYEEGISLETARGHGGKTQGRLNPLRVLTYEGPVWIRGLKYYDRQTVAKQWANIQQAIRGKDKASEWLARNDGKVIGNYPGVEISYDNGESWNSRTQPIKLNHDSNYLYSLLDQLNETGWDTIYRDKK